MAAESHDNSETKAFTPPGAGVSNLAINNAKMAAFQKPQQSGGRSVADREQALFGNGLDLNHASNIYGNKDIVAWDSKDLQKWASDRVSDIKSFNPETQFFPHRGQEDQFIDYEAASKAFKAAHLDQYPDVSPNLVAAAMRNEQHFYKKNDGDQDKQVNEKGSVFKADGTQDKTASIGPAQMQIGKIRELVNAVDEKTGKPKYPFLGTLKDDPIRKAESPANAALLTAAYFAQSAEHLKAMHLDVNNQTLAYTWNPDVFKSNGRYECPNAVQLKAERQLPEQLRPHRESVWNPTDATILKTSTHVQNVAGQLKLIQERQQNAAH